MQARGSGLGVLGRRAIVALALFALLSGVLSPLGALANGGARGDRESALLFGNSIAICTAAGLRYIPVSESSGEESPGQGQAVPWSCPYCLLHAAGAIGLPATATEIVSWEPGIEPIASFLISDSAYPRCLEAAPGDPRGPPTSV